MEHGHAHLKATIKREIMKIYKLRNGKGPERIEVTIFGELLYLKFAGAFSQVEKSLMHTDSGKEIVASIRKELSQTHPAIYFPVIEEIIKASVKKSTYLMDEVNDAIYLFLLFDAPIPGDQAID